MAKAKKTAFFCQNCGYESAKWFGQCPACKAWNTFVEEPVVKEKNVKGIVNINAKYQVCLDKGEVTSITMHLLNALEGKTNQDDQQHQSQITRIIKNVTKIIEDYFGIVLDKNDFNYFRFKIHLKYYVLRKENNEEFMDGNIDELYDNMKNTYPDIYNCVYNIDQYLYKEFKKSCTSNELLYLMIHVTRLCTREDCNRKGITSA